MVIPEPGKKEKPDKEKSPNPEKPDIDPFLIPKKAPSIEPAKD